MRLVSILIILPILFISAAAADNLVERGSIYQISDTTVEWSPFNFAGFYYDIDKDIGNEVLRLNITGEAVETGAAEYISAIQDTDFEHEDWGGYKVLSFLSEEYFVGYGDECNIATEWDCLEDGILSKVLLDSDVRETITSKDELRLEEGYKLRFADAVGGIKVTLYYGGTLIDTEIITPPDTYIYSKKLGEHNVTLIALDVIGNVRLTPTSYYSIKGLFQISESPVIVELGSEYSEMKITSLENNRLVMSNPNKLNLTPNSDFELLDGIQIRTDDSDNEQNRVYIYNNITEPGTYEVRGTVQLVQTGTVSWDANSFAGLYYDLKDDIKTEQLWFDITQANELAEDTGVTYMTTAQAEDFEFDDWGQYGVIGFLGEKYFASYNNGFLFYESKDDSLLNDNQLSKVLIDDSKPHEIQSGSFLPLEQGYQAKLSVDNDCKKIFLELYRNDSLLDMDYFTVPHTYVHKKDLGDSTDVVVLALHIGSLNCTRNDICTVDGIFQISDVTLSVKEVDKYGKMEVDNVEAGKITMINSNKIMLSKNKDLALMGDINVKTADSDDVPSRFYIYKKTTIETT